MNAYGVFTHSCKGRYNPRAPEAVPPQGSPGWVILNSHPGSAAQPHHCLQQARLSLCLRYLSSEINCNQILLPATKIRRVKPNMSARDLGGMLLRIHLVAFVEVSLQQHVVRQERPSSPMTLLN